MSKEEVAQLLERLLHQVTDTLNEMEERINDNM